MCGIAGYVKPDRGASPRTILGMTRTMRRRGPDDEGVALLDPAALGAMHFSTRESARPAFPFAEESSGIAHTIALGHRRFSITDLSPSGHQPFRSADGAVCVAFNGEIYNHDELRRELTRLGHRFQTRCDTEVLVEAYREWGTGCFHRFVGFWAVALYDARRRSLLLARDRLGKAPLYVARRGGTLYFASEIAAILSATGRQAFAVRERAVVDYLSHSYRDVHERTFYEGIDSFPGAAYAWVEPGGWFEPTVYWRLPGQRWTEREVSAEEAVRQFLATLDDAVRQRVKADVPVAFELSGGVDSSCLVASAASQGLPLHAYTVSFPGTAHDEEPFARQVVQRYRGLVDYTVIEPPAMDFWEVADEYVATMAEPFHAPNMLTNRGVWQRMAADGVRVSINGAAGDESWAGYANDYFEPMLRHLAAEGEWGQLIANCRQFGDVPNGYLSKVFLRRLAGAFRTPHTAGGVSSPGGRATCIAEGDDPVRVMARSSDGEGPSSELLRRLRDLMGPWRMNYWLRSGHQNFMSVPTEVRCPFLDHRLVELAFRLPVTYLIRDGWLKWLVRKTMVDRLPPEVAWRKRKMGFPFPYARWAAESRERFFTAARGVDCPYVDLRKLAEAYDRLASGNPLYLWRVMSLCLWWKRCVLGERLGDSPARKLAA